MESRKANNFYSDTIGYSGWKYYNIIKKKAINRINEEFTWSGLLVSLFIAFFICTTCASCLSFLNTYLERTGNSDKILQQIFSSRQHEGQKPEAKNYTETEIKKILRNSTLALGEFKKKIQLPAASAANLELKGEPEKFTHYLAIKSGEAIKYQLKFKNTGSQTWKKGEIFLETGPFLKSFSKLKHQNWIRYYCPSSLVTDVASGQTATLDLMMLGPDGIEGDIQENFQLVYNGRPIIGTLTRMFVSIGKKTGIVNSTSNNSATVANTIASNNISQTSNTTPKADFCIALTSDEKKNYAECNTDPNENDKTNGISQAANVTATPIIRVGLYYTKTSQRVAMKKIFDVYAGNELLIPGINPGSEVKIGFDFKNKRYTVDFGKQSLTRTNPIRLVPREQGSVATLADFDSRPAWNTYYNDNSFRNIIEFQYCKETGRFWVINELPITDYLKGLAETSNYSPLEFQKVLITAARTYAMYHYNRGVEFKIKDGSTKHGVEHFHVDATYDQVYRGYNSEIRMPKLSQAVEETKGVVVAYKDEIVVTPYFSRSDGRTRAWEEVWAGGAKPWLKSVAVPEDKGQTLWGHGVGMSARGALIMARDEGYKWDNILKHFYQGVTLKKIY